MLLGPVFTREAAVAPRRTRMYVGRAAYVAALLLVMSTAWLILSGTQIVRDLGDFARFGAVLFQILAPLQAAVAVFFSALLAASAVAQEKDRRTLVLLLLTHLSNGELVLGKLAASLLNVAVMLAAALPLFMIAALLGGVSFGQIGRAYAVTLASVAACGSLGSTLALWREKTFQALATTVLALVLWLAAGRDRRRRRLWAKPRRRSSADWAAAISPWRAILLATHPYVPAQPALGPLGTPVHLFVLVASAVAVALNVVAVAMVRRWNCTSDAGFVREEAGESSLAPQPASCRPSKRPAAASTRHVWDNPILWREIRTWAYGRKSSRSAWSICSSSHRRRLVALGRDRRRCDDRRRRRGNPRAAVAAEPRVGQRPVGHGDDQRAGQPRLDLLLVTDLTPKEIVFGKLGGVFYNTKEMVLLPDGLCAVLVLAGESAWRTSPYLLGGLTVLYLLVAVVGVHAGINYISSRTPSPPAWGRSSFSFVGVALCMRMMEAFSGSFQAQLQPFLAFMLGGGVGLYVALGARIHRRRSAWRLFCPSPPSTRSPVFA